MQTVDLIGTKGLVTNYIFIGREGLVTNYVFKYNNDGVADHELRVAGHETTDPDHQRLGGAGVGRLQAVMEPRGLRRGQVPPRPQSGYLAAGHRIV